MESEYPLPEQRYKVLVRCYCYNQVNYIEETLKGFVMQQTNFPFVALIVDDCSTDGTQNIIRRYESQYPDKIKGMYLKENHYKTKKGKLKRSYVKPWVDCAEYEAICEGDDYWTDPLKLQKQVDYMDAHPECGMTYGKTKQYDQEKGKFLNRIFGQEVSGYDYLMLVGNPIPTLTSVTRVSLINRYEQEIVRDPKWRRGDYPRWIYIAHESKIHFFDEIFGVYRILRDSASSRSSYENAEEFSLLGKEVSLFFDEFFKSNLKNGIVERKNKGLFLLAMSFKEWDRALYWYRQGFRVDVKNRIRYFLIRFKFFRWLVSYLIDKEII